MSSGVSWKRLTNLFSFSNEVYFYLNYLSLSSFRPRFSDRRLLIISSSTNNKQGITAYNNCCQAWTWIDYHFRPPIALKSYKSILYKVQWKGFTIYTGNSLLGTNLIRKQQNANIIPGFNIVFVLFSIRLSKEEACWSQLVSTVIHP